MISLSIKNPTPKKLFEWRRPTTTPVPIQNHPRFNVPSLMSHHSQKMGKIEYSRWIEEQKRHFKVGDLVTLKIVVPQDNICPWLLRVSYIEEDHNQVHWDSSAMMPAAITCVTSTGVSNHKSPTTLRQLTPEEKELAKLSHTQPLGTA